MGSLFSSTRNSRYLPDGSYKYIRSDAPVNLSDEEIRFLRDHHVTTIIDLREESEWHSAPCRLESLPEFSYYHLPVSQGGKVPVTREQLCEIYLRMLDGNMEQIVHTAMTAGTNVMYFCTAGKDRTGVVSAVILHKLGVSESLIVADYMESKSNLMDMLKAYSAMHPEIGTDLLVPCEENIRLILNGLKGTPG